MNAKNGQTIYFKLVFLGLLLQLIGSYSCKKDEFATASILKELSAYGQSYVGKAVATKVGAKAVKNETLSRPGLPVLIKEPSAVDASFFAVIDTSLIETYNRAYHSSYPLFPGNAFKLSNNGNITIPAGHSQSVDSLYVELRDGSGLINEGVYLVPVRLSAPDGVSLKSSYMYLKMRIAVQDVLAVMKDIPYYKNSYTNFYARSPSAEFKFDRINGVIAGQKIISIATSITQTAPDDVKLSAVIDNSTALIDKFNKQNHSSCVPFPSDVFKLIKNESSFKPGETKSPDSLRVEIADYEKFNGGVSYLLGVRIEKNETLGFVAPDTLRGADVAYIKITINDITTGNVDRSNQGLTGASIDRQKWTITSSEGEYASNPPSNVLDGNNATVWLSKNYYAAPVLTLDMGSTHTVKGFLFTPQYDAIDKDFIQTEIYSSNDGSSWKKEGVYLGTRTAVSSSVNAPDVKTIKLIVPAVARYFKFNIINSSNSYKMAGLAELTAIE